MCGIAGYVGPKDALPIVLDQLSRLEYRGYDSAGVAFPEGDELKILKRAGKLSELRAAFEQTTYSSNLAVAHTRWATHGAPTDINAHPHHDQHHTLALIHNGIIENYLELKEDLIRQGHAFQTETDTEVAAHVIGLEFAKTGDLAEAVRLAGKRFRGAFGFVAISHKEPGRIVVARRASPLVIGFGEGEMMLASDIPALLPYTRQVAILEEGTVATLTQDGVTATDMEGRPVDLKPQAIEWSVEAAEKGGYAHFMLKEIHEQPDVMRQCVAGRLDEEHGRVQLDTAFSHHVWQEIDRVNIVACGTAYHAGLMGKHIFEKMLRLPTDVFHSSEFRYGDPLLSPQSLAIFVSQSGETADSLASLRLCKQRRLRTLGIVNVVGSSIARECDRVLYTQAGPEISVASTKAYTAQVLVFMMLAAYVAQIREMPGVRVEQIVRELRLLADRAQEALELEDEVIALAQHHKDAPLTFFLGRNADAHVSLEAALKLKEVAYMPTQECPAGEMKHGPLALIEPGVPAIFGATDPEVHEKIASNLKEVQARAGSTLVVTTRGTGMFDGSADHVLRVPTTGLPVLDALLTIIPLQLYAYHVARLRGCEIDQPRNLAKSVTVE